MSLPTIGPGLRTSHRVHQAQRLRLTESERRHVLYWINRMGGPYSMELTAEAEAEGFSGDTYRAREREFGDQAFRYVMEERVLVSRHYQLHPSDEPLVILEGGIGEGAGLGFVADSCLAGFDYDLVDCVSAVCAAGINKLEDLVTRNGVTLLHGDKIIHHALLHRFLGRGKSAIPNGRYCMGILMRFIQHNAHFLPQLAAGLVRKSRRDGRLIVGHPLGGVDHTDTKAFPFQVFLDRIQATPGGEHWEVLREKEATRGPERYVFRTVGDSHLLGYQYPGRLVGR